MTRTVYVVLHADLSKRQAVRSGGRAAGKSAFLEAFERVRALIANSSAALHALGTSALGSTLAERAAEQERRALIEQAVAVTGADPDDLARSIDELAAHAPRPLTPPTPSWVRPNHTRTHRRNR